MSTAHKKVFLILFAVLPAHTTFTA